MCDWSYGKLYALHLTPEGSAYKVELEEFLNGAPLPVTDVVVNPKDGALYFTTGGRRTQSGLYRVTYVGKDSTAPSITDNAVLRRGRCGTGWRRSTASTTRRPSRPLGLTWPIRIATSASPPASPSSNRIPKSGKNAP